MVPLTFCVVHWQTWENMLRIATTPSPFVYRHLVVTLTLIYVFTFPIGFVSVLGVSVIPFSAAIAAGA